MGTRLAIGGGILIVYLALVLVAGVVAAVRLHQSSEMPGLAAIELVLLALPWSLAVGVEPLSRLGWSAMVGIVVGGIVLNGLLLWKVAGWADKARLGGRGTRSA
jgi:hypothetical protein